ATAAPYTVSWANVAAGNYTITAVATDDRGAASTSVAISIVVNAAPTVSLTSPTANPVFTAPATVTLTATAADADGSIAKVEFFSGATLIGTATTAPYSVDWANVPSGAYTLSARATDNLGAQSTSAPVTVIVNALPTVTLTVPQNNAVYPAPATIPLAATATDPDGTIAKVEFFSGTTLIGTVTAAPYSFDWTNVPSGAYALTAKATDDRGGSTLSGPVTVTVNAAPAVALIAPAAIQLTASATDPDGTIAKVEFYEAANLLAAVTQPPYSFAWTHVASGAYTLFARATDNLGATTTSAAVDITVAANTAPTVALTSPAHNASYRAPATIALTATAADTDGAIAKVEFFQGATLLATLTQAPYAFDWVNVGAGSYTLTAQATDDKGAVTASAPVTVNVASAQAAVYYIHADHLNTPRVITDQQQRVVWRWDHTDPFGGNVPDEDPDGDGQRFEFNLRFPGQYFDPETNLHYNYFRDCYDPLTGRYCQSDPIGLRGGLNPYAYVGSSPLSFIDPYGLAGTGSGGFSTRYGNWCGKKWSGGQAGRLIPKNPAAPIDSLDACCMDHDYCYAKYECDNECMPDKEKKTGKAKCDETLVDCLDKLKGKAPQNWPQPPKSGTEAEAYFFCQKAKWWFKD
ncbi:MAG: hypothetical protein HYU77_11360, partial [Betaproteobacteria bacterium]|nr:hypothetical protein [Betaproteobacteria bacterium]